MGIIHSVCISTLPFSMPYLILYSPKLESFATRTAHTPLVGLFGALLKDWMPLIDDYYYCMWALTFDVLQIY